MLRLGRFCDVVSVLASRHLLHLKKMSPQVVAQLRLQARLRLGNRIAGCCAPTTAPGVDPSLSIIVRPALGPVYHQVAEPKG